MRSIRSKVSFELSVFADLPTSSISRQQIWNKSLSLSCRNNVSYINEYRGNVEKNLRRLPVRSQLKRYTVLFSTIMKLRSLCSHRIHSNLLSDDPLKAMTKKRKRGKSPVSRTSDEMILQTIAAMQKKKSYLARVTLDAAEHKGETTGLDVSPNSNLSGT